MILYNLLLDYKSLNCILSREVLLWLLYFNTFMQKHQLSHCQRRPRNSTDKLRCMFDIMQVLVNTPERTSTLLGWDFKQPLGYDQEVLCCSSTESLLLCDRTNFRWLLTFVPCISVTACPQHNKNVLFSAHLQHYYFLAVSCGQELCCVPPYLVANLPRLLSKRVVLLLGLPDVLFVSQSLHV